MKLGGTRLGLYDDVGAAASAILSIVERILNLEFLNGVGRGNRQAATTGRSGLSHVGAVAVRVHAVQHEVVVTATRAIGADLLASGSQLRRIHYIGIGSTCQTKNLRVVAICQGQGNNRRLVNHPSECSALGLQQWGSDLDYFSDAFDRKLDGNPPHFANLNHHLAQEEGLKARHLHRQFILARWQQRKAV